MAKTRIIDLLVVFMAALLMISCGGGSGGGSSTPADSGVISIGAVEKLGSIYVNGVRYDTSGSSVTVDDNPGSASSIRQGQTVVVNGSINNDGINGIAESVAVTSVVKGPVTANNYSTARSLTVLGQTVQITDLTVIDNSIADISTLLNTHVEVHGHVRGNGVIEASYLEAKTLTEYKVIGFAVGVGADIFLIGNLSIDYSAATTSGLAEDQLVEVKGNTTLGESGNLIATKVEAIGPVQANAPKIEIEGFVTSFSSSASFTLASQPVITGNSTLFEGGLPEEIALASKLEVEGRLSNGVLQASKVSFRYNIKLEGDIASYAEGIMGISGLPDITVKVDGLTEINGTLAVGRHVRVRAYTSISGGVTAIRAEDRGNSDTRLILQGPIEAISPNSSFDILGTTIDTSTVSQYRDTADSPISATTFYNQIRLNSIVKMREDDLSGSVTWDRAEIEYR